MAFTSAFFDAELVDGVYDRVYSSDKFAEYFSSFISNGVFPDPSSNLQVRSSTPESMEVIVSPGKGWINGYYCSNDEEYKLQIAPADGVFSRVDAVVIRWNKKTRDIVLAVKQGLPSHSPKSPDPERSKEVYELVLAMVQIPFGVTSIKRSQIEDTRSSSELCGLVTGVVDQIDTTDLFSQYNAAFEDWFTRIQGILSEDSAGNLLKLIDEHTANTSNPHSVTAQQIGAAPAGYGLGADAVSVDSWDNATKNGFYKSNKGTPDGDGNYWHGIVVNYSGVLCNQLVWKTWGTGSMMATRRVNDGVPEEWEWLDPPSIVGVEYLTTERYWGEKVYTKLIDCGVMPVNSSKTVSYGTTLSRVIRCTATTENGAVFPRFTGAGNSPQMTVNPYTRDMQIITTNIGMSIAEKVLAQIWYVK